MSESEQSRPRMSKSEWKWWKVSKNVPERELLWSAIKPYWKKFRFNHWNQIKLYLYCTVYIKKQEGSYGRSSKTPKTQSCYMYKLLTIPENCSQRVGAWDPGWKIGRFLETFNFIATSIAAITPEAHAIWLRITGNLQFHGVPRYCRLPVIRRICWLCNDRLFPLIRGFFSDHKNLQTLLFFW